MAALPLAFLLPGVAQAQHEIHVAVGPELGFSLQNDQYVLGATAAVETDALVGLEADVGVVAGLGADFTSLRPSLHGRGVLRTGRFNASLLAGGSLFAYWPRGGYATFCDETRLDDHDAGACSGARFGAEVGAGLGFRPAFVDATYGAVGDIPLWTVLAGARFRL